MTKNVSFEGIGYLAATLPVSAEAKTYLEQKHMNAKTGNVDINDKHMAVKLNADGTVGFGAGAATDVLFGVIVAYEMDGFASVQIMGGLDNVPTDGAVTGGAKELVVTAAGKIKAVEGGRKTPVVKASTTQNQYASIIL